MQSLPIPFDRLLVVAHGSRAPRWVAVQRAWFAGVAARLEAHFPGFPTELTFLEITEPLFSARLQALRDSGERLAVFPFFMTKSGHAGEDVPEEIEEAFGPGSDRVVVLDAEGWEEALAASCEQRLRRSGATPEVPVVVSGYGAASHGEVWPNLVAALQARTSWAGRAPWLFAPSGHFLADYKAPLREALQQVRKAGGRRVAVLPLYLSISTYQEQLIPSVLAEFPDLDPLFTPDAILPDPAVEDWAALALARALREAGNRPRPEVDTLCPSPSHNA